MKILKSKLMVMGLAATTLFTASGCGDNETPNVYGPPTELDDEDNEIPTVYGPPEVSLFDQVDPDNNEMAGVYGPPPEVRVEDNEIEDVYGPPEDFDIDADDNEAPTVYGPPEDFDIDIDDNENVDVYGPPEADFDELIPGDDEEDPDPLIPKTPLLVDEFKYDKSHGVLWNALEKLKWRLDLLDD
ncbi:MAG: hypothetical protein K6B72_07870 [Lachnospiraceae bacterium]|nr:hypothetical protein [Lachnospiraceae bacterium]